MKTLPYAGRHERMFANFIDSFLLLIPSGLIASLMSRLDTAGEVVVNPASLLFVFMLTAAYYTLFTAGKWQATPGKRVMRMKVVRVDGRPMTERDALERFIAYSLPTLPVYTSFISEGLATVLVTGLSIAWFWPILSRPDRAGIHDQICGTRVVVGRNG